MKEKKEPEKPVKKAPPLKMPATPGIFNFSFRHKCLFLLSISFLLYVNTLTNQYALDDSIAIERNTFVQHGIQGIPKILTSDSYESYYKEMTGGTNNQYSGGRYRPLSLVSFAIEQQLAGDSPFLRHLVNILAYMACIIAIFYFLDKFLFKNLGGGGDIAFFSTFLFVIHPIHTEVVANIKSLDEILSLFFTMLTFIFALEHLFTKKQKFLWFALGIYFLALMGKEYGVMLVILLPLLFYLLAGKKPAVAIKGALPYYGVAFLYLLVRFNAVGIPHSSPPSTDVLINPFVYATHIQKIATEWWVLGKYVVMLFYPYPLSSDYSYLQVPYRNFSDVSVLLSVLLYLAFIGLGIRLILKKNILAFLVFFYLFNILLISNFLIDIGAPMGERLIYQSSLSFVCLISYFVLKALKTQKLQIRRGVLYAAGSALLIICGSEVIERNGNWKNDDTLFIHDVHSAPNSCLIVNNASYAFLSLSESPANTPVQARQLLDSSKKYAFKALKLDPDYVAAFLNLGGVYFHFGLADSARYCWEKVNELFPGHPSMPKKRYLLGTLYCSQGKALGQEGNYHDAIRSFKTGLAENDTSADLWYNLGGACFVAGKYDSARMAWNRTLQLKPDYKEAINGLAALGGVRSKQ